MLQSSFEVDRGHNGSQAPPPRADLKVRHDTALVRPFCCRFCRDCSRPLAQPSVSLDLNAFLQGTAGAAGAPKGAYNPQWLLLLMAILRILIGCSSIRDLKHCAIRHHRRQFCVVDFELRQWYSNAIDHPRQ